jgi:cytidylate kinase
VGRKVASELNLRFVDSGLMYRAIACLAREKGVDPSDGAALTRLASATAVRIDGRHVWTDGVELTDRVYDASLNEILSRVSRIAGVRLALVAQQRKLARGGVVMAGRDIGTVVFPDADFKFFLTASLEERVRRRAAQYERRGERVDAGAMAAEVAARDKADSERTVAPLRAAEDAEVIDTEGMGVDDVVRLIVSRVHTQPG